MKFNQKSFDKISFAEALLEMMLNKNNRATRTADPKR